MTPPSAASDVAAESAAIGLARTPQVALPASSRAAAAVTPLLRRPAWARIRVLTEIVVLYVAACAALLGTSAVSAVAADRWIAAAFPLVVIAIMRARPGPEQKLSESLLDTVAHVIGVVSLAAVLVIAFDSAIGGLHPVGLALRLWLFSVVYLGVARVMLLAVRRQAVKLDALATPTLIVGAGVVGEHLVKRLAADPRYGLRPVGFLDADPVPSSGPRDIPFVPILGDPDDLAEALERTGAGHVIVAFSSEPDQALVDKVRECQQRGVEVSLVPRLYELVNERATLDHVGGLPLVSLRPTNPNGWQFAVKHAIDRVVSAAALLALAPAMLAIAAGIRLTSPGPVLFRQRRVGRDGRAFDLLKFRTMRDAPRGDASASGFEPPDGCAPGGVEGRDRRTALGRFLRETSIDELPQLINVLRGEMSLVGPRPERPEFVQRFSVEVNRYDDRHRVKSGITGWAQVNGLRGQTSITDRVEWDNAYIQNWSLWLDLRVIALTIAEVLRFRG